MMVVPEAFEVKRMAARALLDDSGWPGVEEREHEAGWNNESRGRMVAELNE